MRKVHLNKGGLGMFSETACGRDILRTPLSVQWSKFKEEPMQYRCATCDASKTAALNTRRDFERLIKNEVAIVQLGEAA